MKKILYVLLATLLSIISLQSLNVQATTDTKAPVIEEIKMLTTTVTSGEKLKIQVRVSDDTQKINTIRATFLSPNNKDKIFIETNFKEDAPFTNMYTLESEKIPTSYETGQWRAGMIQIRDITGAFTNYTPTNPGELNYDEITFNLPASKNTKTATTDNFKALKSMNNTKVNNEFSYTFNTDVANATFTKQNIYVLDKNNKKVPLIFIVERAANRKKSTITIVPLESYNKNSKYTLYIKDISGKDGKKITQNTKMEFTTVK